MSLRDQGFTLTKEPTVQADMTLCRGNTCASIWTAVSPSGREADEETDFSVSQTWNAGDTTIRGTIGYYLVPGKEVWDGVVDISRPVNDRCAMGIRGEAMRGGFNDTVVRAYGSCTFPVAESLSASVTPSIAYSDWSGRAGAGLTASLDYTLDNGVTLSLFGEGYVNQTSDGMVGIRISGRFGN